jgi:hypothetical protein
MHELGLETGVSAYYPLPDKADRSRRARGAEISISHEKVRELLFLQRGVLCEFIIILLRVCKFDFILERGGVNFSGTEAFVRPKKS